MFAAAASHRICLVAVGALRAMQAQKTAAAWRQHANSAHSVWSLLQPPQSHQLLYLCHMHLRVQSWADMGSPAFSHACLRSLTSSWQSSVGQIC